MNTREEKIMNHEFFADKSQLAKQIIDFEKNGYGFLPNSFSYKILLPDNSSTNYEKKFSLGRLHDYYFIGIEISEGTWKYQAFENDSKLITFISNQAANSTLDEEDEGEAEKIRRRMVAYWLNQIEKLA